MNALDQGQTQQQQPALEPSSLGEQQVREFVGTATYSPDDNKLRLTPFSRLDASTYDRVKAAGFKWAPKQGLFVAPTWTPQAEDLLLDLAGEIGDEDTSLVERAAVRAERFEEYSDKRANDAECARAAVAAITDNIPLGQPILLGHHSERKARKDAERIEAGMRRAVRLWDTSQYWQARAAGALRAAKYKERPDVRARRIKGLESQQRKFEKTVKEANGVLKLWHSDKHALTHERACAIAGQFSHGSYQFPLAEYPRELPASQYEGNMSLYSALTGGVISPEQARELAGRGQRASIAWAERWLVHLANRLAYERAMYGAGAGIASDRTAPDAGGAVRCWASHGGWSYIKKVNKVTVTILDNWGNGGRNFTRTIPFNALTAVMSAAQVDEARRAGQIVEDELGLGFTLRATPADWVPPPAAELQAPKKNALAPLTNYPGSGDVYEITDAEFKQLKALRLTHIRHEKATAAHGEHRCHAMYRNPEGIGASRPFRIYVTDKKRTDPPAAVAHADPCATTPAGAAASAVAQLQAPPANPFAAMKEQLRLGVQVVTAPTLFPTPRDLAARMVELADIKRGDCVLEPSAGTGVLLLAMGRRMFGHDPECGEVYAVEIVPDLARKLDASFPLVSVRCGDFLAIADDLPRADKVLMNPPFDGGIDVAHVRRAFGLLKPGGVLVAICANGPRQREQLGALVAETGGAWEDLPADTFKAAGTSVRTALITLRRAL